jgi:signal peptidase I
MQPTLFGITEANLLDTRPVPRKGTTGQSTTLDGSDGTSSTKVAIHAGIGFAQTPVPGKAVRVANWFRGETWYHLKAEGHWKLLSVSPPSKAGLTKPYGSTKLTFEDLDKPNSPYIERTVWYTWFDNPPYTISHHGSQQTITSLIRKPENFDFKNMISKVEFNQGEDVFKFKVTTGDHLFVNRITYNFRNPRRGDIAVFIINIDDVTPALQYHDVNLPGKDTFYIKRLVALGGEQVSIGEDRHLNINDKRLTSADRGFEFVYSHSTNSVVENSVYSGHEPIRLFPKNQQFFYKDKFGKTITNVPKNHFLMFGDNTENSQDSRYWGAIPRKNVMGVSSFVYWPPFSPRFGWSHR